MGTISKALDLLDLFSENDPELGLSDVQRRTGRDKATLHRHLTALASEGFLEQDPASRAYRLGPALTRLAAMRARTVPEATMVREVIDRISREAGELVHLSRVRGFDLVDIYHVELHDHPVRVNFDAYGLPPLFSTASGKAFLAFSPPETLTEALKAGNTRPAGAPPPDRRIVEAELARIRRVGFATSRDALRVGVSSVAIPVFDAQAQPAATCSIAYPSARGGIGQEARLAALLKRQGMAVTEAMGGRVPDQLLKLWSGGPEKVRA